MSVIKEDWNCSSDLAMRWVCPRCGEIVESDYTQIQVSIALHGMHCKALNNSGRKAQTNNGGVKNDTIS